ncbi:MAG: hypothetical protein ACOC3V_04475 [bacterium]
MSKMKTDITVPAWMLLSTFRYCLTRHTYIVSEFIEWVTANIDIIPDICKEKMINEIDHHLSFDYTEEPAFHNYDKEWWSQFKNFLYENSLKKKGIKK